MMNTTGTMVVQVLSGPTRQMLRRSMVFGGLNSSEECQQSSYQRHAGCYISFRPRW
jgi:hypothetical protein